MQCDGEADQDLEEGAQVRVTAGNDGAHLRVCEKSHRGLAQQSSQEYQDAEQCRTDGR